jgi:hypothetical protein
MWSWHWIKKTIKRKHGPVPQWLFEVMPKEESLATDKHSDTRWKASSSSGMPSVRDFGQQC